MLLKPSGVAGNRELDGGRTGSDGTINRRIAAGADNEAAAGEQASEGNSDDGASEDLPAADGKNSFKQKFSGIYNWFKGLFNK